MKELLEKLAGLIPGYFEDLLPLISRPKRFIEMRISGAEPVMQRSLIFLAVSFLIGWVLKIPLSRSEPLLELGPDAAFVLLYIMGYGAVLCIAWRIVGGKAEIQKFLTIHFYYSGILKLIESFLFLSFMGTLRATDAAVYKELLEAAYSGDMASFVLKNSERLVANPAIRISLMVEVVGYAAGLAWMFAGWGAYRKLNHLSKIRSMIASLLFFLFCIPVTALVFFVANALVK